MRGKDCITKLLAMAGRITPAHAGKRFCTRWSPCPARDHPRPCGEKSCLNCLNCFNIGSPPPMRGKVKSTDGAGFPTRITPAHAGKRCYIMAQTITRADHPRPCGEKNNIAPSILDGIGSPPPMRGKAAVVVLSKVPARITPAHAGKSPPRRRRWWWGGDHPRPCGEKRRQPVGQSPERGSPPPMRGKEAAILKRVF